MSVAMSPCSVRDCGTKVGVSGTCGALTPPGAPMGASTPLTCGGRVPPCFSQVMVAVGDPETRQ